MNITHNVNDWYEVAEESKERGHRPDDKLGLPEYVNAEAFPHFLRSGFGVIRRWQPWCVSHAQQRADQVEESKEIERLTQPISPQNDRCAIGQQDHEDRGKAVDQSIGQGEFLFKVVRHN